MDIYEAYEKYLVAWRNVPKMPIRIETNDSLLSYSCPECGTGLFTVYMSPGYSYTHGSPVFHCGKLLI